MQKTNTELFLIRITGEDRPGLTTSVTEILARYDATILDIGQADIHNTNKHWTLQLFIVVSWSGLYSKK